ncbi:hypothetical protein [Nocardioides sp. SR21]|uniref:hypothetical protein n=1 Tax=Nocardioides sp. SR21 TaxID=2919501 RepID=UPI001FAA4878|nr:hypothetical protein [Nocardioides sp. SR21]
MRRHWPMFCASLLAATALALGGWLWMTTRAADGVEVTWRDGDPTCTGTTTRSDERFGTVVAATSQMRCRYTIEISNDSDRGIHLVEIEAPGVGPETGSVVTVDPTTSPAPVPADDGLDAVYPLDQDLAPGESTSVDIVVVFHPEGCNDGGTFWMREWPVLNFETLGSSFDRAPAETFAFHRNGSTPGCDDF